MKTRLTILILMLTTIGITAQPGINYKALIKDGGGNVVASQSITIQFIIYEGVALTNNVYQETHTPNTDANGIIIINIGEGAVDSGIFVNVDWGNDDHYLNVQINTGGGLTDMGTTQFMAVPYALSAANVTGFESIDEGNGIGWRLVGSDPANYGNIGENAIDLSYNSFASTTSGATGFRSIAMGINTTASGSFSTAMGVGTEASGNSSTAFGEGPTASGSTSIAMGFNTTASGVGSTAMGRVTIASGEYSTAMGSLTTAPSFAETVVGSYNTDYTPVETGSWDVTDRLFVVGNGADVSNKSNALTVLKNGTITAPSFDMANITDNRALVTKEYGDTNYNPTGLEAIDEGNGIGWRLVGRDPANYGNIGENAVDLSFSGGASTTKGATGNFSTALGGFTIASGDNSTAMRTSTEASGVASTAMGLSTEAPGLASTAMGVSTTASSYGSTAIGRDNVGGGNASTWVETDKLFEIGNGNFLTHNAFTVLKNGKVGISTPTPTVQLQITGGVDASLSNGSGYLVIGNETANNIVIDDNEIIARNNGITAPLILQHNGGDVWAGGSLVHSSDRRLKKDIVNLPYGLSDILQLQPKAYNWKNREQKNKSLGLIAQDVQSIIKEIIHIGDDEDKTLSLSYTELIPVLIKAIQEQQEIIETQNKNFYKLLKRVEQLEISNNQ